MGALTAPTSMALTCRVEEPSTASIADIRLFANPARTLFAVILKRVDIKTRSKTSINELLRD